MGFVVSAASASAEDSESLAHLGFRFDVDDDGCCRPWGSVWGRAVVLKLMIVVLSE